MSTRWQRIAGNHAAHGEDEDRQAQDQADPEPPAHVDQLGIGAFLGGDGPRLQRHAALRTGTGMVLPHFRVHRDKCKWPPQELRSAAAGFR